jgi:DNA methylase
MIIHPLQSICPYFAMFPPGFVERYVLAFTEPGDIVFDPFCGRGTTIFESLLLGRYAYGVDINPVAACVSAAKAAPPLLRNVERRVEELRAEYADRGKIAMPGSEFFRLCYSTETLRQICFLREQLKWRTSKVDCFIAATSLGCLHGESHRTENCFSNRMPRTISTKPDYSVRWWRKRGLEPPKRNVFDILRRQLRFRYSEGTATLKGGARLGDVRNASLIYRRLSGRVNLLITSPPYLDTTDYGEDQWLRLWFLGGEERPRGRVFQDARHELADRYWDFMELAWRGVTRLPCTRFDHSRSNRRTSF